MLGIKAQDKIGYLKKIVLPLNKGTSWSDGSRKMYRGIMMEEIHSLTWEFIEYPLHP
jgi:hypothetical protein